jgi:hypothetical protein
MKNISIFLILSFCILTACEKGDPEIAPIDELSSMSFSESFMCQPLNYQNHVVALIKRNDVNSLCSYNEQGIKDWQKSIDQYIIPGININYLRNLSIDKASNGEILLNQFVNVFTTTQLLQNQVFKVVDFDANSNFQWQRADSIHQPDTIIINLDTIGINQLFKFAGKVNLSNGYYAVLSSQINQKIDSTYLQISIYNRINFISNIYLKIKGSRTIEDVFCTKNDELILFNKNQNTGQSFIRIDIKGNIIFELKPPVPIVDNYFFYETSQGNFIVSASAINVTSNFTGIVFCINAAGNQLWINTFDTPPTWVMVSVQEKPDAYIFSGFTTTVAPLPDVDWRSTFLQNEYHAVIQKTSLEGQEIWNYILPGIANTSGASTIGTDRIGFYGGKFDNNVKNIILLKLDSEGNILN